MESKSTSARIHPLVAGAAISVMLVSLTGVAAITGLIPTSHGTNAQAAATENTAAAAASPIASSVGAATSATSPAALVESKENNLVATPPVTPVTKVEPVAQAQPVIPSTTKTHRSSRPSYATEHSATVVKAPAVCSSCGEVVAVQPIHEAARSSGLGVVAGAVVGGLLGNQVGNGNGRTLATVAGAVGGGYAGNEVEKHTRGTTSYQVRVRMEDGQVRTFPYAQQPSWTVGDRVRVVNGQLASRA